MYCYWYTQKSIPTNPFLFLVLHLYLPKNKEYMEKCNLGGIMVECPNLFCNCHLLIFLKCSSAVSNSWVTLRFAYEILPPFPPNSFRNKWKAYADCIKQIALANEISLWCLTIQLQCSDMVHHDRQQQISYGFASWLLTVKEKNMMQNRRSIGFCLES